MGAEGIGKFERDRSDYTDGEIHPSVDAKWKESGWGKDTIKESRPQLGRTGVSSLTLSYSMCR